MCVVMNKAKYYKFMFIITGIWNIITAVIFGLLAPIVNGFLPFFGLVNDPKIYLWMYSFLMLVAFTGFKYILVGLDFTKNHLVISTGIMIKISFALILLVFFILGQIQWTLFIVGIIDLIFAALFVEFYINYKKLESSEIASAYSYKQNM